MKWVVIFLLLLNGAFLAVQMNKEEQTEQLSDDFPLSGTKLVLLAEKERQDKAKRLAKKNKTAAKAKPAPKPAKKAVVVKKPAPKVVAKPKSAPAPKLQPKPEPRKVTAPKPAPRPVPTPIAKPESALMSCYSMGPFLLISDVKGVSKLFAGSAIGIKERSEALRKQAGYWVYIPPMPSRQLAHEVLSQIEANEITDAMIVNEGAKVNAISAGIFKTEALARERQNNLVQLGFDAKVDPLFRTQPQYWLDLELTDATQLSDSLWQEITAGYPKIKQFRRKCEQ